MKKKLDRFVNKRCLFYSDDNYTFLNKRQFFVAQYILHALYKLNRDRSLYIDREVYGKKGTIKLDDLYRVVSYEFNDFIGLWYKYTKDNLEKLKETHTKWILRKIPLKDEYRLNYLNIAGFNTVLWRLNPLFLNVRELGSQYNKARNIHTVYSIKINQLGIELCNEWLLEQQEVHEKLKKWDEQKNQ